MQSECGLRGSCTIKVEGVNDRRLAKFAETGKIVESLMKHYIERTIAQANKLHRYISNSGWNLRTTRGRLRTSPAELEYAETVQRSLVLSFKDC